MPKRIHAIPDHLLQTMTGDLSDDVLLLPAQVMLLTGLSIGALKERMRTRPPKPPHPEPREKPRAAVWYSLGSVRRYRVWLAEQAAINAHLEATRFASFAAFLHEARAADVWPFALVGPHQRPVDFGMTLRGDVAMTRADTCAWLTLADYLDARSQAAQAEQAATREES